ncbi:MAG: gamma carbonic anhydrase family protein [Planctomycetota bacterium]|nr:gamma carbonic anhydrase family protein [Planctomycetota bacterium]
MAETDPVKFRPELVADSAFVARSAVIVGDVTLGDESSVWFNAVIRGDVAPIKIGPRTNVQDGAVLHADEGCPCTLGAGVTVGHNAIVHGCQVEDNVLIGMGSVVMNRAVIGRDSIIGVGAVVTEGTQVPPRSLVLGVPAKVKRELADSDLPQITHASEHYVQNARRYRKDM